MHAHARTAQSNAHTVKNTRCVYQGVDLVFFVQTYRMRHQPTNWSICTQTHRHTHRSGRVNSERNNVVQSGDAATMARTRTAHIGIVCNMCVLHLFITGEIR